MILSGAPHEIMTEIHRQYPQAVEVTNAAASFARHGKQQVEPYQAAALAFLASKYNREDANILEIGTYYGYTAACIGLAAPYASIVTLNPHPDEVTEARKALKHLHNVKPECIKSWDYLKEYSGPPLDMIFVDGDHKRIALDLPWFDWVRTGGLMLFHDYTPLGAYRHCPPVYDNLNASVERIGRGFDVLIVDDRQMGMAGWYRRQMSEHLVTYPHDLIARESE